VFIAAMIALNFWFDLYHVGGLVIDGIILIFLCLWLVKSRKSAGKA